MPTEEIFYTVYMHTNKQNGKRYIGITSEDDPSNRWGYNGVNYKPNKHFYAAILKYGWDNFQHDILFQGLTKEEACSKEIELIANYNTSDPDCGYNQSLGGDGHTFRHSQQSKERISKGISGEHNPNWQGKSNTPEQMQKLRDVNLGSHHSEEHKKKIGDALRGRKHHTEEHKKEMSEKFSVSIKRSDGIVYPSFKIAANENGVTQPAISNSMRRKQKCAGYYWDYA